jgi:heat shock protein HslJ
MTPPRCRRTGTRATIVVLSLLLAAAGCAGDRAPDVALTLGSGTWVLAALSDGDALPADALVRASLSFDPETRRVSGSNGCNRIGGAYAVTGDSLSFGPLATTRMACLGPAGNLETRMNAVLSMVTSYGIAGGVLTLRGPAGPLARFTRAEGPATGTPADGNTEAGQR